IPQYSDYTSRAKAAGAATEISSTKQAIAQCYNDLGTLTGCTAGTNGVPTMGVTKNVTVITSVTNGRIQVTTGATTTGGTALTIDDQASINAGDANMKWTNGGTTCTDAQAAARAFKSGQGDCP